MSTTEERPEVSRRSRLFLGLQWMAGIATVGALLWSVFEAPSTWWLPALFAAGWALLRWWTRPRFIVTGEAPKLRPIEVRVGGSVTLSTEDDSIEVAGVSPTPADPTAIAPSLAEPVKEASLGMPGSLSVAEGEPYGELPPPPDDPPKDVGYGFETTRSTRSARETEPVRFQALYPARIAAEGTSPFWAYAFEPSVAAEVLEDADLLQEDHGLLISSSAAARKGIESGVVLIAKPEGEGLRFDPPQVSVRWRGRWRRFDFRVTVEAGHPAGLQGRVSFTVEGLLIAEVPFELTVGESLAVQTIRSPAADPYQAVFPSYSHRDTQIVERVERAYRALGMSYLRDVKTLRSGQKWRPELGRLIEQADLFQLFWSSSAAESEYVAEEWQSALRLIGEKKKPETFIRPVFWEQPMPEAPTPLGDTQFAYEPDLEK